ncbi:MAG: hypothetical protein JJE09_11265, partial [Bacteroidia bacterium]|nr:hypothetical protein [Bacteroidia bacterium]
MFLRGSILVFLLAVSMRGVTQIVTGAMDTTRTANLDTIPRDKGKKVITIESYSKRFDPRKALLYAALLPGAGQAYNKKYWKMPLVYGGFAASAYIINFYQGEYNKYKGELFSMLNDPSRTTSPSGGTQDQVRSLI